MATAQDHINRALRLIGVLAAGETPTSTESNDSLTVLNDMLGLWNIDKLLVYQIEESTHTLVAGTRSYTIGSGATINQTRPVRIEKAWVRDSSNLDFEIDVIGQEEYNRYVSKTSEASYPYKLWYDTGFANGTINLYPTPASAFTLHFTSWKPFSSFATLTTDISLPEGYAQLLVYNLAVLLAAEFSVPVRQDVIQIALDTKAKVETINNENQNNVVTRFDSFFGGRDHSDRRDLS